MLPRWFDVDASRFVERGYCPDEWKWMSPDLIDWKLPAQLDGVVIFSSIYNRCIDGVSLLRCPDLIEYTYILRLPLVPDSPIQPHRDQFMSLDTLPPMKKG